METAIQAFSFATQVAINNEVSTMREYSYRVAIPTAGESFYRADNVLKYDLRCNLATAHRACIAHWRVNGNHLELSPAAALEVLERAPMEDIVFIFNSYDNFCKNL